jgi:hypothetical protein
VRARVGEDRSDYPSDIRRGNRRGLASAERQFDAAAVADGRTREREKGLQVVCWIPICETVIWDDPIDVGSPDRAELTAAPVTKIDPLSAMRFPSLSSNSEPRTLRRCPTLSCRRYLSSRITVGAVCAGLNRSRPAGARPSVNR